MNNVCCYYYLRPNGKYIAETYEQSLARVNRVRWMIDKVRGAK